MPSFNNFLSFCNEQLDELFENGREIELSAGSVLHDVHDTCTSLGKIVSGRLRMSRVLSDGREIFLKEFLKGEIFGELLVFTGKNYPGRLTASVKTEILEVPFEDVLDYLNNRDSLISFMNSIAQKNRHLADTIEILSLKTVKQKIAFSLLMKNELEMTFVTELADKLVCSREALSRALAQMEQSGLICRKSGIITPEDKYGLESLF